MAGGSGYADWLTQHEGIWDDGSSAKGREAVALRRKMEAKPGGMTPADEWFLHLNACENCSAIGSRCKVGDSMFGGKTYNSAPDAVGTASGPTSPYLVGGSIHGPDHVVQGDLELLDADVTGGSIS